MVTSFSNVDRRKLPTVRDLAGSAAVVQAALGQRRVPLHRVAAHLAALARLDGALALRRAMVLAWVKQRDLADLGYPTFGAFVRERVDGSVSWERALRRLVESPLDEVKAALCQGRLRLRVAVRAPAETTVGGQAAWLAANATGAARGAGSVQKIWIEGEPASAVRRGRHLARLLLGRAAPTEVVDDRLLVWHRRDVPAAVLLEKALAPREAPEHVPLRWDWCKGDPAQPLLGAWRAPSTLREALARLDSVQVVMRTRRALLAQAWALFCRQAAWATLGYSSARRFASEVLDWSPSTEARYRRLGWRLEESPAIRAAVREGLGLARVGAMGAVLGGTGGHVARWLAVVRRIGGTELSRAMQTARTEGLRDGTLRDYERAIALADASAHAIATETSPGGSPTTQVEPEHEPVGAEGEHETAEVEHEIGSPTSSAGAGSCEAARGTLRVALPQPDPPPWVLRRGLWVLEGVVEAARWLLQRVSVPPQHGFGRVKERDRFRCQNPECGRIGLRCHAHHEKPRCEGGSDALSNGITLCRVCHLRLIHAQAPGGGPRLAVRSVVVGGLAALLWTWASGRRVLQFREWPGRGAWRG